MFARVLRSDLDRPTHSSRLHGTGRQPHVTILCLHCLGTNNLSSQLALCRVLWNSTWLKSMRGMPPRGYAKCKEHFL